MPDPLYSGRFTQAFAITPSDVRPIQGPKQSNGQPLPYCSGIHVLTSGNLTVRFKEDAANSSVTLPVTAGEHYPYALSFVYTASTATLLGLV